MKTLIVEDEQISQLVLQKILGQYGESHLVTTGPQAVSAYRDALRSGKPFDLVCLDIVLPDSDGMTALSEMRRLEQEAGLEPGHGAKVIMTTVRSDSKTVMGAFREQCDAYLVKPVVAAKLLEHLRVFGLIAAAP